MGPGLDSRKPPPNGRIPGQGPAILWASATPVEPPTVLIPSFQSLRIGNLGPNPVSCSEGQGPFPVSSEALAPGVYGDLLATEQNRQKRHSTVGKPRKRGEIGEPPFS